MTQRKDEDLVEILSGVYEGKTTGTPICLLIRNTDQRSKDYSNIAETFRPGHADYTYWHKYGIRDPRGGGRSSARLTAPTVAAGAVAKKWLREKFGIEIDDEEFNTVGGHVFGELGRKPQVGDEIETDEFTLRVEGADKHRILKLRLIRKDPAQKDQPESEKNGNGTAHGGTDKNGLTNKTVETSN